MRTDLLGPAAIPPHVTAFNAAMAERAGQLPSLWEIDLATARSGKFMPHGKPSERSYDLSLPDGPGLHVVPANAPQGVLLHIHGGGFMLGGAARQDAMLERIADHANLTCVSVEYRLAPEHPYPAAWDDCETAARWLIDHAADQFGSGTLVMAGESAGALLAVATLVRLRDGDRDPARRFCGAALSFGVFDTSMTPSQRLAADGVLKATDIARITDAYAPRVATRRDPDVSPLYADLRDLPPVLFTVGTLDAMLDDSLFMYARWLAAGNRAKLALYPGADHAFTETPHPCAADANARIDAFLASCLSGG